MLETLRDLVGHKWHANATLLKAGGATQVKLGLYFPLLEGWREWNDDER